MRVIDIYVCEDNPKQLNQVVKYIENYLLIENLDMRVRIATDDSSEILNYLDSNEIDKSLYFIDIELGENHINGIELASKIRKIDFEGKIVFITNHSEMVFLTFKYQIEALDFILKDYMVAIGLLNKARNLGLNVPEDLSIVSIDGTEMCRIVQPQLTSVSQNFFEMGKSGVQRIEDIKKHKKLAHLQQMIPTRIEERQSIKGI